MGLLLETKKLLMSLFTENVLLFVTESFLSFVTESFLPFVTELLFTQKQSS